MCHVCHTHGASQVTRDQQTWRSEYKGDAAAPVSAPKAAPSKPMAAAAKPGVSARDKPALSSLAIFFKGVFDVLWRCVLSLTIYRT